MVLVEKWRFFQLFFLGKIRQENVFYDFLERKNACLGYKNKKFKKSKNWHFSKGVNPCCWSKTGHFSNFYAIYPEKWLLWYSRTKKRLSRLWKQEMQKVEKFPFLHGFFQKWPFFQLFFLGNKGQENVFYDILER